MKDVVIVSGTRTAVGSFGGTLKTVPVVDLGAVVMKAVLKKVGLRPAVNEAMKLAGPDKLKDQGLIGLEKDAADWHDEDTPVTVDEVIMGNVLQAAQGQNTARQAMIRAGLPKETPAVTSLHSEKPSSFSSPTRKGLIPLEQVMKMVPVSWNVFISETL